MKFRKTMTAAGPSEAMVERLQEQVRIAKSVESIPGRQLLEDAATNPAVASLREGLSLRRQRGLLKQRHRAALRTQARQEYDAAMDDRGHRLIRERELATSPARRAAGLARLQRWVVGLGVAGIIGLGAASTAGVHAFLVGAVGPQVATAAWGVEPAIIILVAGGIIARSVLLRSGGKMPGAVTALEWGALLASIAMNWAGSGAAAAIFPIGVAVMALVMQQLLAAIAAADVNTPAPGQHHPAAGPAAPAADGQDQTDDAPAAAAPTGAGGTDEDVRRLLQQALEAEFQSRIGDGASEVEDYLAGASARTDPERSHGGSTALLEHPDDPDGDADGQVGASERRVSAPRSYGRSHENGGEEAERVLTAQERRRLEGERNRARVADYLTRRPSAPTTEIADALDLGESTVRRIRREIAEEEA